MVRSSVPQSRELVADPNLDWDDDPAHDAAESDEPAAEPRTPLVTAPPLRSPARGVSWQSLPQLELRAQPETTAAELRYFIAATFGHDWQLVIGKRKRGAELGPLLPGGGLSARAATEAIDRELTSLLHGFRDRHSYAQQRGDLSVAALAVVLPRLAATGRCHLVGSAGAGTPPRMAAVLPRDWRKIRGRPRAAEWLRTAARIAHTRPRCWRPLAARTQAERA